MESTYLFTYRMRGNRKLVSMRVHALNLPQAYERFHHAMGQNGAEYDQYTIVAYRQIRAIKTLQPA